MATVTTNLGIVLIQPTDYFADESFNRVISDLDTKVVGIVHLKSKGHWATWEKQKAYTVGDIIRVANSKSNQYYQCITAGTSGNTEPANNVTGSIVNDGTARWLVCAIGSSGDASGIQIWLSGVYYRRGDAVLYDNAIYRCMLDHTAAQTFDLDANKFTPICADLRFWSQGKYYGANDIVIYDNRLYICNTSHTSQTTFDTDSVNWDLASSFGLVLEHVLNHRYIAGEMVTVNNRLYRCKVDHVSSKFASDISKWDSITSQIPSWTTSTYYSVGDIIQHDGVMYQCVASHTSTTDMLTDISNWKLFHDTNAFLHDWVANSYYEKHQLVRYNSRIYRCTTTNTDAKFTESNWELLNYDIEDWSANTKYYVGQYVSYENALYRCITANADATFKSTNWKKISGGTSIAKWKSSTDYSVGALVLYDTSDGISSWVSKQAYSVGDKVVIDDRIYKCTTANSDTDFTYTNWQQIDTVVNNIYECITANKDTVFTPINWTEINSIRLASIADIDTLF